MAVKPFAPLALLSAVCAVGLAAPPATAAPGAAVPRWHVVLRAAGYGGFRAITAPSRTSVWAFGTQQRTRNGPEYAAAQHWNGRRWSPVQLVSAVKNSKVACAGSSSATNLWAFTEAGNPLPVSASAVTLRNGRWKTDQLLTVKPDYGSWITGCNVLGPADVWVFGGEVAGAVPAVGTWHRTRPGWKLLNTGNLVIFDASEVSATTIWAAGADVSRLPYRPVLARWNGHTWTEDRSIDSALPKPTAKVSVGIAAIHAVSARDVWVEATTHSQRGASTVIVVHGNGTTWHRVRTGSPGYYLPTAVPDGHGGWWAAPYAANYETRYLLHEANGRWTKVPMPAGVLLQTYDLSLI